MYKQSYMDTTSDCLPAYIFIAFTLPYTRYTLIQCLPYPSVPFINRLFLLYFYIPRECMMHTYINRNVVFTFNENSIKSFIIGLVG